MEKVRPGVEEKLRAKLERSIPNEEARRNGLALLAAAIENADEERPDAWCVRETSYGIALMAGRLLACKVTRSRIRLSVIGPMGDDVRTAIGAESQDDEEFKKIPGGALLTFPAEHADALAAAALRVGDAKALLDRYRDRESRATAYVEAYRHYCWPVESLADLKLAPFHLLASSGGVHVDRDHVWHMETLARVCGADPEILLATPYRVADVTDAVSQEAAVAWWDDLTSRGGEGMVVKPLDFVARDRRGVVQPALKSRGREYLRIIYGPEYDLPENLERLRSRGLSSKRSLALREFALGIEGLERFVRREPLRRVHECAFGVLALESEPVDPRL